MSRSGDPQVDQVLVVSTAHVTKEEAQAFDGDPKNYPGNIGSVATWEYGWFVWVGSDPQSGDFELEAMSPGLRECIQQAWQLGCVWLRFDCDGHALEGVPTYDW